MKYKSSIDEQLFSWNLQIAKTYNMITSIRFKIQ